MYIPLGLGVPEEAKDLALSLGADPISLEKDMADMELFSTNLSVIFASHPVTKIPDKPGIPSFESRIPGISNPENRPSPFQSVSMCAG